MRDPTAQECNLGVDSASIEPGSDWLSVLEAELLSADLVVVLVDEKTLASTWAACEIESSVKACGASGRPEIIVLKSLSITESEMAQGLPTFVELLRNKQGGAIRIWADTPGAMRDLPHVLARLHLSSAIFSHHLERTLSLLFAPILALGFALGSVSTTVLGWAALGMALALAAGLDARSYVPEGWSFPVALMLCFYAGYASRLALASAFEIAALVGDRRIALLHAGMAIAYGVLAAAFLWTRGTQSWLIAVEVTTAAWFWAEASILFAKLQDPKVAVEAA